MSKKDFFICCSDADREWGDWIDWQLRALGFTTFFEPLDVQPGENRPIKIDRELSSADRTIVILSPQFDRHEWSATFTQDPDGEKCALVPVRVSDFNPRGLLAPITRIDLYGIGRDDAVRRLRSALFPEPRPEQEPRFPGAKTPPREPSFPGQASPPRPAASIVTPRPETIAALLDKIPQARQILRSLPHEHRLANGRTRGFLLAGHYEEWPEALRHRLAEDLALSVDTDVFVPLQGKELEDWIPAAELLRNLLAAKLLKEPVPIPSTPAAVEQRILECLSQPLRARIFYRVLYPDEVRNGSRIADLLDAWHTLGQQLPSRAPSHVLLLLYAQSQNTSDGQHLDRLTKRLARIFRKRGFSDALLPEPVSPLRGDVSSWALNYLPPAWQDDTAEQVLAAFEQREAMPHGELKRHVLRILKPFIEQRQ